jgi:hypothetical protein
MKNRIKNYFRMDNSLGIDELNARYVAYYFNEGVKDSDERNASIIRDFLRESFDELGLQTDCLLREFDMKRKAYQAEKGVFCRALKTVAAGDSDN